MLDRQAWDTLADPIAAAGADPRQMIPRLRRYAELVVNWNRSVSNLISRNDEGRIVARHLLESLTPAAWMKLLNPKRVIDFGSGAGFPGIPLALVGLGESWTLVESRRPKILFMRKALLELGLSGIHPVHARLESLVTDPMHRYAYDVFTSRATLHLGPTLTLASEFVRSGGAAFLWKGSRREEEMEKDPAWNADWDLDRTESLGDGSAVVVKFNKKS